MDSKTMIPTGTSYKISAKGRGGKKNKIEITMDEMNHWKWIWRIKWNKKVMTTSRKRNNSGHKRAKLLPVYPFLFGHTFTFGWRIFIDDAATRNVCCFFFQGKKSRNSRLGWLTQMTRRARDSQWWFRNGRHNHFFLPSDLLFSRNHRT